MLASVMEVLEALGILMVGLVARLGLVIAIVAAIAVPVAVVALAWMGGEAFARRLSGRTRADGLAFRTGAHHAPGHTWLRRARSGAVRVGPDGLVPRLFDFVEAVRLPALGTQLREGDTLARIVENGREARILSPVAGRVARINPALARRPDLVKDDPYGRGWLCQLEGQGEGYTRWPKDAWAREWLTAERRRIDGIVEEELGLAAADGGELLGSDAAVLTDGAWRRVARAMLGSA